MDNADNDNTTEIKLSREQSLEDSNSIAQSESEEKFGPQVIALSIIAHVQDHGNHF
jgi:hypothetical protein